jgi:hypothetical protein
MAAASEKLAKNIKKYPIDQARGKALKYTEYGRIRVSPPRHVAIGFLSFIV